MDFSTPQTILLWSRYSLYVQDYVYVPLRLPTCSHESGDYALCLTATQQWAINCKAHPIRKRLCVPVRGQANSPERIQVPHGTQKHFRHTYRNCAENVR